jgi:UDP-N-acetylglucosamine 2-epimerase (non-hydrolysing)
MPEEHNRILTDHAADLLLAPTQVAMDHLATEGLTDRARLVGDVMTDVCFRVRDAVSNNPIDLPEGVERGEYVVATVHRAENTDDPAQLAAIVDGLADAGSPVLLLAHPRLVAKCAEHGIKLERPGGSLHVKEPLAYPEMVAAVLSSAGVVTDSGGLQKEAFLLGRVCTTLRTETEWVETLEDGWNVLTSDMSKLPELAARPAPTADRPMPYGDGHAAERVVAALTE